MILFPFPMLEAEGVELLKRIENKQVTGSGNALAKRWKRWTHGFEVRHKCTGFKACLPDAGNADCSRRGEWQRID
jgi:hypothetical protein